MNCRTGAKGVYFPPFSAHSSITRSDPAHPIDHLADCEEGLQRCRRNALRRGWRKLGYCIGIAIGIMLVAVIASRFQV